MRKPETIERLYLDFDGFFASVRNSDTPDSERTALALAAVERGTPQVRTLRQHNDETLDNPVVLRNAVVNFYDTVSRLIYPRVSKGY